MKKYALFLFLNLFLTHGYSQQTADTLKAVILESERLERPRQLIPESEVTPATLKRYNPADLISPLNETPGLYIFSGSLNTNRLTIRGVGSRTPFGTNKVKAYINQIPVTNGVGETSFGIFDPEALGSIQVVKGPKATVYGANLGGTLLLNPLLPSQGQGYISTSQTLGSYNQYKQSTQVGIHENDLSVFLGYDHLQQDGYRENNAYNRNGYLLNMKKSFGNDFNLKFLFNHINYSAQIPSSLNRSDYLNNPEKAADNWAAAQGYEDDNATLAGITAETRISGKLLNTTSIFTTYNDHYEPRPFNILDENTFGAGFRSLLQYAINEHILVNSGLEHLRDRYSWRTYENLYEENNGMGSLQGILLTDNREKRSFTNVFTEIKVEYGDLRVQAGINYNNTRFRFTNLPGSMEEIEIERDFNPVWSPNITLTYQAAPQLNIFLNTAHGYAYPSLEETLNPEGLLNPEIAPEKGWNYETGILYDKSGFRVQTSVYFMRIRNLLVAERTAEDQLIGRNAGVTHHFGLEYSIEKQLPDLAGIRLNLTLNGTHNWHRFETFADDGNDFAGNKLTGVPEYILVPGIQAQWSSKFYTNLTGQFIGSIPVTDANTLYSDPYGIFNLRAGYTQPLIEDLVLELNGGINNVLNKKYASSILINASGFSGAAPRYYYPGLPVNFYLNVHLRMTL
ncbi:TonB-dependent receptor [Robertkochia flava]|uniref:TonB-dependent receptor n=1 Tax=Robertkochia flava TaxID=3447986 RepID=UPI001CC96FA6|nr:TonB-dependent receptor [Robertkochia marina]